MEMEVFGIAILLISFLFLYKLFSPIKPSNNLRLPLGPAQLPIIGSLHKLGTLPHRTLGDLAKIHGPIMSLKLGSITTVVISSLEAAKEILQKQDVAFSTRFVPDSLHAHDYSKYSVIWLPITPRWRNLKKVLTTHMFSATSLNANKESRGRKIDELVEYCRNCCKVGGAVDIGQVGFSTSLNLLSNMMFSRDLTDLFDDSSIEFKELAWNIFYETGKANIADFFPWLKRFDPQGRRRRLGAYFRQILKLFNELICERLETRKSKVNDVDADLLDVCLNITRDNPDEIDRVHMERLFVDLFVAGTDTTSSTLEWAMSELLRHPDIMIKAKLELKQVIGHEKIVRDSDIANLPYLDCVIKEILRLHPPGPLLVPRTVETNIDVFEYVIPKGSQILVNVYALGRDPTLWEDPLLFKPERFLVSNMDVRGRDFELIPFGSGRRACPGIPLALRIESLMLGSLLNCFDWKIEGGIEPKDLDMGEKSGINVTRAQPLRAIPTLITLDD